MVILLFSSPRQSRIPLDWPYRTLVERGSSQGGVISPLIANVYLDAFDQFMKSRGHRIVRYADDILILCSSRAASENALNVATAYIEGDLKLTVNRSKTHLAHSREGIHFLGVVIHRGYTRIQMKKLKGLKAKLKWMTRRNSGKDLGSIIAMPNRWLHDELGLIDLSTQRVGLCVPVI